MNDIYEMDKARYADFMYGGGLLGILSTLEKHRVQKIFF